jgi:hypothetical protein
LRPGDIVQPFTQEGLHRRLVRLRE